MSDSSNSAPMLGKRYTTGYCHCCNNVNHISKRAERDQWEAEAREEMMNEPHVVEDSGGLSSILALSNTAKQNEYELHCALESEFNRTMQLLKANNGVGAMTAAMWLLYEDAYYSQGYSGLGKWKQYLKNLESPNILNRTIILDDAAGQVLLDLEEEE